MENKHASEFGTQSTKSETKEKDGTRPGIIEKRKGDVIEFEKK